MERRYWWYSYWATSQHSLAVNSSLLIQQVRSAPNKKLTFSCSSKQKSRSTKNSACAFISSSKDQTGSNEFLTPFASRWDRYLLLSKKRFRVCWGDILKFFDINMVRNYKVLVASRADFFAIYLMSTLRELLAYAGYLLRICYKWLRILLNGSGS